MPSHCDTKYVFVGSETEIADLHDKIKLISYDSSISRNLESLGSICGVNCEGIDCDGDIGCYELETPTKLELEVITGHRERSAVFVLILKNYPSIQCYFSVECNDSDYYVTNDYGRQHFPERFIVKQDDEEPQYFNNPLKLFEHISEVLSCDVSSMEQVETSVLDWNNSNDENQIRVSEIELVDDLCQMRVKSIVGRMESVIKRYPKIRYSEQLYQDIDFVAKTLDNAEFVWVLHSTGTVIYRVADIKSIERLVRTMDFFDEYKKRYTVHHHTNTHTLRPRSSEAMREWAKERIKELTEPTNAKS